MLGGSCSIKAYFLFQKLKLAIRKLTLGSALSVFLLEVNEKGFALAKRVKIKSNSEVVPSKECIWGWGRALYLFWCKLFTKKLFPVLVVITDIM